ncbi:MAG: DMT family transporter [Okeania sp. SIO2C9]|uniref:DMT family transporter n=1 Tax=Okeania sp. SIO2C9 TaxID=2607791 RepID=UPI0013BFA3F9|nr:DMT family transporter [Okeania sp. SIO2C9]NEQ75843.1 DMT family transporter [Okeania sp. SIO2C9]
MKPPNWRIVLVLTIGVLAISTSAILIKLTSLSAGMSGVGFSLVMAASRVTIAALLLVPAWSKIQWQSLQSGAIPYALAAGVCLAVHYAFWITSLSYISIATSTTLVTTNPIWVALLSRWWLKERLSRQTVIGIVVAMVGGIIIGLADIGGESTGINPLLGNFLALMGAWVVSLYILLGREAQTKGFSVGGYLVIVFTVAGIVLLPFPLILGVGYSGYSGLVYFYLLLMALFPQLVGNTSLMWAVRWLSPTLVSLAILFEPVGASFLGYLLLGEVPSTMVFFGVMILLIGVAIAVSGRNNIPTIDSN